MTARSGGAEETGQASDERRSLSRNSDFLLFIAIRLFNVLGIQMLTVAVGWQVYQMTRNPLDLGWVGLSQFAPVLVLFLLAGLAADRFDRRKILAVCNAAHAAVAGLLLIYTYSRVSVVWPIFLILVVHGAARSFFQAASQAILPNIVPVRSFPNAVAYSSSVLKVGQLVGPAMGGVLIAVAGDWVYLAAAVTFVIAAGASALIAVRLTIRAREASGWEEILGGIAYIFRRRIVLGAISIDLVAVLFGGVVGILPVFASDILHVGPEGLGMMRAMPAFGAIFVGILLARLPQTRRMGPIFFVSLTVFGASVIVFSLSEIFWLSLAALAVYGASDMVSVYIRQTLVQVATPDGMRGRVSAVNAVSITASNELGDFRAGVMAAGIGTVPAVFLGGVATLAAAALWWRVFPSLGRVDRLDQVE
ncbi:MAG: MFS transporter [Hyphomicrobiales bacterium]|nr:MFS transporter [Hyphomicrobiales bacterium]